MEVFTKEKVITEKVINVEFSEEEALIVCLIMGRIGGAHDWRKVTSGLYHELIDALGRKKYDAFNLKYDCDVERSMYLRDKDRPSILDNVGQSRA
jgi:hypothetical protein